MNTPARPAQSPSLRELHLQGGRHGILLFHGLSSSPLELQFLARGLHRAGYTVKVPVMQGYTYGPFGEAPLRSAQTWVAGALKACDAMLNECETVAIGGLCLGAVLASRVAALRSDRLSSLLCLSAALHYDGWGNPWYTHLLPLARVVPFSKRIRIREREPYGLKDTRMRAWVARQMRELGESDAGAATLCVADLLKARDLIDLTRRSLGDITIPTLVIHAREDECATPRSAYEIADKVSATRTRVALLNDSYHMISIDREKETVLSELLQFLSHGDESALQVGAREKRANVLSQYALRKGTPE
jgi:carboxylesterase